MRKGCRHPNTMTIDGVKYERKHKPHTKRRKSRKKLFGAAAEAHKKKLARSKRRRKR